MLIETVRKAIHGRYQIKRKGTSLLLEKGIKIHATGKPLFGFSLDNEEYPPFRFFKESPPKHLSKMCDAIIVFESDGTLFFAIIEQKTGYPSDYGRQLANGKLFCEWLVSLCKEHGYIKDEIVDFLGVLIWEPRPIPLKGSTVHTIPQAHQHRSFERFFDIQNETEVNIELLASSPLS